jgi:malate dehydrogenase
MSPVSVAFASEAKPKKEPIKVLITGAAGQIGYSLIPLVATGQVFGPDQPVILHLVDIEPMQKSLNGVVLEIEDGAYPLVEKVIATHDYAEGFAGIQAAFLVGGFPRKQGMERKELLQINKKIFVATGEALKKYADPNVKVLVVANPANTNCLVALNNAAPAIPSENFTAMTRLDANRAQAQVAKKLGLKSSSEVSDIIIWGNHSSTQVPDAAHAKVAGQDKSAGDLIKSQAGGDEWLSGEFVTTVQKRGAAIIAARGLSSAMSAANAAKDHMRDWYKGTDGVVSMAVLSDGTHYDVAPGIVYSFPVKIDASGKYTIVDGLQLDEKTKALLKNTEKELQEEKAEAFA